MSEHIEPTAAETQPVPTTTIQPGTTTHTGDPPSPQETSGGENGSNPPAPEIVVSGITVVEQVYHYQMGHEPTLVESRYNRPLAEDEQPYVRRLLVDGEWRPLDMGWLAAASLMVIVNEEGHFRQAYPTDDQRKEAEARVIEVGMMCNVPADRTGPRDMHSSSKTVPAVVPCWEVGPRESSRVTPIAGAVYSLRCRSGKGKCTLHLFPR